MLFLFPETYHPGARGFDRLNPAFHPRWRPVLINPFQPLELLRSPDLLMIVSCFTVYPISITLRLLQTMTSFSVILTEYGL